MKSNFKNKKKVKELNEEFENLFEHITFIGMN